MFAAIMASVPALLPQAEATVVVNPHYPEIGFDKVVYFTYDIETGSTYEQVTYAIGCTDRLYVTGVYNTSANYQAVSWQLPNDINYMCGISEFSSYTNFALDSVDWKLQGPNGQQEGTVTSNMSGNGKILYNQYANSGTVHVEVTAHYLYAPLPASP